MIPGRRKTQENHVSIAIQLPILVYPVRNLSDLSDGRYAGAKMHAHRTTLKKDERDTDRTCFDPTVAGPSTFLSRWSRERYGTRTGA